MRRGRCCCLKLGSCPPPEGDLWLSGYSTNIHGAVVHDEFDPVKLAFHWSDVKSWAAVVPLPADSGLQTSDLPGCVGTLGAGTLNYVASLQTNPYASDPYALIFTFTWLQRKYGATHYPDPGVPPLAYSVGVGGSPSGWPTLPWAFDWSSRASCWTILGPGGYGGAGSGGAADLILDSCRPFLAHTDDANPIRIRAPWNGNEYLNLVISEEEP